MQIKNVDLEGFIRYLMFRAAVSVIASIIYFQPKFLETYHPKVKAGSLLTDHAKRIAGNIKTFIKTQFIRVFSLHISKSDQEYDGVSSGLFQQLAKKIMGDKVTIFKKKPSRKERTWMSYWNNATSESLRTLYLPDYLHHIAGKKCIDLFDNFL